jgi:Rrf2 family protein
MFFSVGCEHAIRAMTYLAANCPPGEVRQVKAIAEALGLSQPTVAKVMHELVRRSLVRSNKGRGGGFLLDREPGKIRLMDIVVSIDGGTQYARVFEGCPQCNKDQACPVHADWYKFRDQIVHYLEKTSIRDLATRMARMK